MQDLALLQEAALEAGRIAVHFAEKGVESWEKPDDQGPVTEADLAVNTMLKTRLLSARPEYGWLSEESPDDSARLSRERVFILDPLDGTRAFMRGDHAWGHSLAIAEQGQVVAAVVYMPRLDRLYAATLGGGAVLNGVPIQCTTQSSVTAARVLAARPVVAPINWAGPVPDFAVHQRAALAYRMSLVAQGRFDAMITLRPTWEWDVAAGTLIAREAGAIASDRAGRALVFNNPAPKLNGVVAAGPALHGQLLSRLAFAPRVLP
ncbi:3'(2'),5'-bisphosphate nucleotidase CysQ [Pseudooceanicola sp. CBS1P-1]|uniref:3'(2'),5'-bisphosphate nucleotidase CysQ n=1 Tax=Pseudooceanicola albus TaxID=2692189 RepID=A0A6L7FXN7_9RHOB|nr:3'(2'),5'-bisphosphate nucleotidase CysQ [Pseudooceanicola endophyticus]MXN16601.1 3'(2'),5'-bisphosphate nucleotidase CysQ [Pseudooceanicola albus]